MVDVTLPEGTSQNETEKTVRKIGDWLQQQPGVKDAMEIIGFGILANGQKSNTGVIFVTMDDWSERKTKDLSVDMLIGKTMGFGNAIPQATVVAINPPPIDGMGTSSGFTIEIENRGSHTTAELAEITQKFIGEARKRPEIGSIYTSFSNDTPSYQLEIDRDKVAREHVAMTDLYSVLQTYYGSYQVNDFTTFGRNFKVVIQAAPGIQNKDSG